MTTSFLHWGATLAIYALLLAPVFISIRSMRSTSKQERALRRIEREDHKERMRRQRSLTFSPSEKIWMAVSFVVLILLALCM